VPTVAGVARRRGEITNKSNPVPAIASKSLAAGAKSLREKESRGGLLNAKERKIHFMSDKIEFPWQELFRLRSDAIDHSERVRGLVEFIRQKHCRPCLMAAGGYRCSTHCEGCDIWELTKEAKP